MVAATRGLDRGRTDRAAVDEAFAEDLRRWIEVQQRAGLDLFSDGLLRWADLFRPLAEAVGSKPHTLVRWFDTNTFFRQPEFENGLPRLQNSDPILADRTAPPPRVMTLPSPYLFSRAAHASGDRNRLMREISANVLRPVIDAAVRSGVMLIHLQEPWIPYEGIDGRDWDGLAEALEALHSGLDATLVLHLYFGDAAPYLDRARQLPVDAVGVDFTETDVAALGTHWEKGLVAGIINGRDSRIEPLDRLVDNIRYLAEKVQPGSLYLSSNCELTYLPVAVAERKVARLGEASRTVRELVAA